MAGSLRGRLLLSGYDGYDAARRVLNPTIDKHPALIIQPSGVADIMLELGVLGAASAVLFVIGIAGFRYD